MPKKVNLPFNEKHTAQYGLKVVGTDANGNIRSVVCRFCITFGREINITEADDRKRKRTPNVKYFSSFRTDNYMMHLTRQHLLKWAEYKLVRKDPDALMNFFDTHIPFTSKLDSHFQADKPLTFIIDAQIVDTVIAEMLFDPEDEDEQISKQRALSLFSKNADSESYSVTVKNVRLYQLCIRFIACGSSIRLSSRLIQATKEAAHLSYLGGASETKLRQYVRVVVAICLQQVSDVMKSAWTYSIALDTSTHQSTSYLEVCLRIYSNKTIKNYHLMALPMYE